MRRADEGAPMAKATTKKTASNRGKARHDDERYGEVLYSFSYEMDDLNYFNAAGLVGSNRIQQIVAGSSMVLLLLIIGSLYDRERPLYRVAITAFILFIVLSIVGQNWTKIRDRYVSKSSLAQIGNPDRHVIVTAETMVVEGPDDTVSSYPLSEFKKLAEDSDGALAKFGKRRYVYIPRKALSETRFRNLAKMLQGKRD